MAPMLPTPDTSHVAYERVYEPAEDSFLFLDTLSSASETAFLRGRFLDDPSNTADPGASSSQPSPPPLVVEVGPGSGVVIGFVNAHAGALFGTREVLTAAVDVNGHACRATGETARKAAAASPETHGTYLGAVQGDLAAPLRDGCVDVLIFNPPYVPTPEMPRRPGCGDGEGEGGAQADNEVLRPGACTTFDGDSYLLALSYAGGRDGMETTDRLMASLPRVLSERGCAYVLLCAQNRPEEVKARIRGFGESWRAETVGSSGKTAGWEKLQIIRAWRA
ncbi:hypothetical protein DL766_002831 [Monosporascus sp. MC13-8B]|uniref:Methyltransferase small domain-containing protein n=1 Tax=Monosporascus cannonballus TaxID=155416 RepID=A0ABY0H291_9PEZI|nr:hypothetical protein DL762_006499 [Monosporascus cannonballus]RYO88196.1 hypothetical protein DL763_006101 [Monosporascus cannonballus]RYP34841.1 hypothetical protein DL766_002831 [Monosporascus sp. MC13-8B]